MTPEQSVTPISEGGTLKSAYASLEILREPFLERARNCAKITIPSLILPKGHTPSAPLPTPYQALGARGVNNLASKLTLTLLPPNQPFFKLSLEESIRKQLGAKVSEVDKALNTAERIVTENLETTLVRPGVYRAFRHLLVAGNVLTYDAENGDFRAYPLSQYVCERDPAGNVLRIILHEKVAPDALPEGLRAQAKASRPANANDPFLDLHTGIVRRGEGFDVWQEVEGVRVQDKSGYYPVDKLPWNAQRLVVTDGESYGRSYVEDYIGDLLSLEVLTKAMTLGAAAAARIIKMVAPNGMTDIRDLENAESGDYIVGRQDDVTTDQLEKTQDLQVTAARVQRLEETLAYVFLMNSAIQRDAERVTAEEIRFMAMELETALGGLYSSLAQGFQLPLVSVRMARLQRAGKLPSMPKDVVRPMITTGVDAIGRGNDAVKLTRYAKSLTEVFGPEGVTRYVNGAELANRLAAAEGIETDGLVKTEDEIQAEQEAEQQAAMQQAAVAPTINQAGQMVQAGMPAQATQ